MPIETLVIAPKSAGVSVFTVKDSVDEPVDFTQGTWTAHLEISLYPNAPGPPIFDWTSEDGMLIFQLGKIILNWDPDIVYEFTRAHFDLYVTGPNVSSDPVRVDHGPVRIDF
jgi:hypothetical protein